MLDPSSLANVSFRVCPEKKIVGAHTAQVVRAGAGVAEALSKNGTMRRAAARSFENMNMMNRMVRTLRVVM